MITALTIYGAVKLHKRQKARKERKRLEIEHAIANTHPPPEFMVSDPSHELRYADERPLTAAQQSLFNRFSSEIKKSGDDVEEEEDEEDGPPSYEESATGTWVRQQQQEQQQQEHQQLPRSNYQMINATPPQQQSQSGTPSSAEAPPPQLPVVEVPTRTQSKQQTPQSPAAAELPSPLSPAHTRPSGFPAEKSRTRPPPMDAAESYASSRAARRADRPAVPAVESKSRVVRIAELFPNQVPAAELPAGSW